MAKGTIKVNDKFMLKDVALVSKLKYNLLSVSQLCDENLEVCFKKDRSRVLDASESPVFNISQVGRVFFANFDSSAPGPSRCLIASENRDLFFWHRRLGHIGFDHLSRISGMDLIRGLPKLKASKDLVCAPCRHGKMTSSSHKPVTMVMTDGPGQLLHMDTVGPARVQSIGGKWYVLVVVDDFSRYSWIYFLPLQRGNVWLLSPPLLVVWLWSFLVLFEPFTIIMALNLKILHLNLSVILLESNISFLRHMSHNRMEWLKGRTAPLWRWHELCLMSLLLQESSGLKLFLRLVLSPIVCF
jgi:Integrase core domain.